MTEFSNFSAKIVIVGRDRAKGDKILRDLREAGGDGTMIAGDVTDPKFCDHAVDETLKNYGRLDVW